MKPFSRKMILMLEIPRLLKELAEAKKKIEFLKKQQLPLLAWNSLQRRWISTMLVYQKICARVWTQMASQKTSYLPKCLLQLFKKSQGRIQKNKASVQQRIVEIYHGNDGVPGYWMILDYLVLEDIIYLFMIFEKTYSKA